MIDDMDIMQLIGDAKIIFVKVRPDDSVTLFRVDDNIKERIKSAISEKYRDKIIGFQKYDANSYKPIFDSQMQKIWDDEYDAYISKKAMFCQKYGCD